MAIRKAQDTPIPTRLVGPVAVVGDDVVAGEYMIPLATYEAPLWPSVGRGARVATVSGGVRVAVVDERMSRSILLEAADVAHAVAARQRIEQLHLAGDLQRVIEQTSRFAELLGCNAQIVGNLLYCRFEFLTGDASGHNMVTLACQALQNYLLEDDPRLEYGSISANFCTDKKNSAVNGLLGRGKNVVAEVTIPRDVCIERLHTTPEKIVDLNIKKNLLGSIISGGVRTANAHFANMLLAFYLATGQDAANIVEGSQGFVHCELRPGNSAESEGGRDLYFSVTLPNLIVGAVGNGKGLEGIEQHLQALGCKADRPAGDNAKRLAAVAAAAVLCGELSLLAAQTLPGALMQSHVKMERST